MSAHNEQRPHRRSFALLLGLALLAWACNEPAPADDGVVIGLLLPFTGSDAATGSSLERAAIMAVEQLNEAGGLGDRRVRLVARDTHSDTQRGLAAAEELLALNPVAILGPESAELGTALLPRLRERQIVYISPMVAAGEAQLADDQFPWFRLAPSASVLGEALAKRLIADDQRSATLLTSTDSYSDTFQRALRRRYEELGGTVKETISLDDAESPARLRALSPDVLEVLVLAAPPTLSARIVNDLHVAAAHDSRRWYLSPALKTDAFLQNTLVEELEGAVGVAPQVSETASGFTARYAERWNGDVPLEGSYFYFDAVALLSIAWTTAAHQTGAAPEYPALRDALMAASTPTGITMTWNRLGEAFQRVRDGYPVYYSGLTGPILLATDGERRSGLFRHWALRNGVIEHEE